MGVDLHLLRDRFQAPPVAVVAVAMPVPVPAVAVGHGRPLHAQSARAGAVERLLVADLPRQRGAERGVGRYPPRR